MKTIVGVDLAGTYEPALQLCLDLGFPDQEILFLHAVEPLPNYAPPTNEIPLDAGLWMQYLRKKGYEAVTRAETLSNVKSVPSISLMVDGSPVANLLSCAEREHVDLVAVGTDRVDRLTQLVFGSIVRGLAISAKQSVLVTKTNQAPTPPIKALFATDHSEYANRCLEMLLQWAPRGIVSIDVVTAYEIREEAAGILKENLVTPNVDLDQLLQEHLRGKCEEVSTALAKAGYPSQAYVRNGHPNTVLGEVMEESGASLMIVGAQGHGFLERLLIGSVSLHQVAATDYPVLLLRVPRDPD